MDVVGGVERNGVWTPAANNGNLIWLPLTSEVTCNSFTLRAAAADVPVINHHSVFRPVCHIFCLTQAACQLPLISSYTAITYACLS